ncbi:MULTISPECIES: conjugative transposon protein TraN [Chryseobacterium group]|uniref:Conjugal transfer protein TrbN n=3 Tax=Chryseobacterium group TaxID=2782232 RepID=A0A085B9I8_9FLAO|nr:MULTISPECIES: conjugative transposon protein TraN [Chryseobacterium group]AZA89810.1 conjugative transposon protein TraN [Chryseobacterium nakagawai]KFC19133.1 conjugal transfer protein TrbN [Epilithonimonas lactis]SEQ91844.1 Bacteroides conjugative transposon TraN protein [Epilithonimonas lactis]SMP12105.1 Bacteroides conjugative transposon TraN protein [Chryseobacterium profundimaris]VEH21211.1 Bacteroides conjugative transposon TraN protein [Chryseobacterium nakagawai]
MNKNKSHYLLIILFLLFASRSSAQDSISSHLPLEEAKLKSFKMQVTYNKTSHLLFPSRIRYVDLGSDLLIASKADPIGNVLRVKSAVRDFEEETNFSVITEDGKFYNFDVYYSSFPDVLSYDLLKQQRSMEQQYSTDVLFEDLKGSSSSLTELIMENLYEKSHRTIKHIASKSFGIQFSVRALHVNDNKYYFTLQLNNSSNVAYEIEWVTFKIVDKKILKRTVVQDKLLVPIRVNMPLTSASHHSDLMGIYLLDQFTLLKDQVLEIEILEKNGGRHQKVELENKDLINARLISGLTIK